MDTLDEDDTDDDVDTELDVDAQKRKTSVSENILYKSIMLEIHNWFPNSISQKLFKPNLTQFQWRESRLGITKKYFTILFFHYLDEVEILDDVDTDDDVDTELDVDTLKLNNAISLSSNYV